jgi:dynein heavy chain, axonemal
VQFIGCMGPPGGGRNPVTARFLRHFSTLSFAELADKSVARMFTTILSAFAARHFAEPVAAAAAGAVDATIRVYNAARVELLPTPSRSHYTFNLRDVARVVQGVTRGDPKTVATRDSFLALWLHESARVFQDRLVCDADVKWCRGAQDGALRECFGASAAAVAPGERLIFGDFMIPSAPGCSLFDLVSILSRCSKFLGCLARWRRQASAAGTPAFRKAWAAVATPKA